MNEKRKVYEFAEIEVIYLSNSDIITTSTTSGEDPFDKVITDDEHWD